MIPNRQNNSMSPLANLRNVRISLQKQEQVLVQKFHAETLNQITKLMFDAELTPDDIIFHINSNNYSSNKVKRQNKANVNAANSSNANTASNVTSTPTSVPTPAPKNQHTNAKP